MRVKLNKDGSIKVSEHDEQVGLFSWAEAKSREHPELKLMFAIPNGSYFGNDMVRIGNKQVPRRILQASKMRAEGVRAGVPDVAILIPRKPHHGLFIELKVGNNKPSEEQLWWLEMLNKAGYRAEWCVGQDAAKRIICEYLGIDDREFI
jgi:hypothetical protein